MHLIRLFNHLLFKAQNTVAIKPTIYKQRISLSDLERNYYDSLNLTIALHPSETIERMVARVLAFCLNADQSPSFTKGLSAIDEPDIWLKTLDDNVDLWIDVGEPVTDRIKKASRQSKKVIIYSFNSKSNVWWEQSKSKLNFDNVEVVRFNTDSIIELSTFVERTSEWSITITGQTAFVATEKGEVEVAWEVLTQNA